MTNLCQHALRNGDDSDLVSISIRNEVNVKDKAIRISFGRKDQFSADVILMFGRRLRNLIRVLTKDPIVM